MGCATEEQELRDDAVFAGWMACVDRALEDVSGLDSRDWPDCPYRVWHETGLTASQAAEKCLERAGHPDFQE